MNEQEQNKLLAKEWHEAFGTEPLLYDYHRYLHDDFAAEFFDGQMINKAQYIQQDQQFAKAFRDNRIVVEEQIAEGDKVVSLLTWTAVHIHDLPGIPATGNFVNIKGIAIDHFKDGKVIWHYPLFDQLKMMQQMGVVKPAVAGEMK